MCETAVYVVFCVSLVELSNLALQSFVTRTVKAIQKGKCIFTTSISFMLPSPEGHISVTHQSQYPGVPTPKESQNYIRHLKKNLAVKSKQTESSPTSAYDAVAIRASPSPRPPPPTEAPSGGTKVEDEEIENGMDVRFVPPSSMFVSSSQ